MKFSEKDSLPLGESEAKPHTLLIFTGIQMVVLMFSNVCLLDRETVALLLAFFFLR